MKFLVITILFLATKSIYADFGKVVRCSDLLKKYKKNSDQAECRQGKTNEVTFYSKKDEKIYIDPGNNQLEWIEFNVSKAQNCLDLNPDDTILDATFNQKIKKWIIFKTENSYHADMVYLLDQNYDLNKFVLTFMIEGYSVPLNRIISLVEDRARVIGANGTIHFLNLEIPKIEELKKKAFNYYEMRSLSWTFIKEGLKDYPAHKKVSSIFNKCQRFMKEQRKKRCFNKEGKFLQLDLLKYVKKNFDHSDYNTQILMEYLGDDKKKLKQLFIANSIFQSYREMQQSEVMNLDYDWDDSSTVSSTVTHFGSAPAHQLTYYLNTGNRYLSIGHFATKPSHFSVRYTYYPIDAIQWE